MATVVALTAWTVADRVWCHSCRQATAVRLVLTPTWRPDRIYRRVETCRRCRTTVDAA